MADLSSLMRIAPTTAASFIGASHRSEQQDAELKRMELEHLIRQRLSEDQRKSELHPFELDKIGLANQTSRAALPGVGATAESLMLDAEKKRATQASGIAATNFENNNTVRQGALGQLESIAAEVEGSEGVERHLKLNQAFERLQVPPQVREGLTGIFNNIPASQLPNFMRQLNSQLMRNTPEYAKTMDQEREQQRGATQRQGMANASAQEVAKIGARKKEADLGNIEQQLGTMIQLAGQKGARALHSALVYAETVALRNGMTEQASTYAEAAQRIRPQAEAEISNTAARPGEVDPAQLAGMPTNPNRSIAPGGTPPPTPQPKVQSISDLQKLYPGVPAEKLKEAYKKKFGVDIK